MIDTEEFANKIQERLDKSPQSPGIGLLVTRGAAEELVKLLRMGENVEDFERMYFDGFVNGRQTMLKDIIKLLGRAEWYGGDKQKKRTD